MTVNPAVLAANILGMGLVFALVLFLAAGSLTWPAGWLFLGLFMAFVVAISLWLLRYDPALLSERLSGVGRADQKGWDKLFQAVVALLFFGWLALMALDAGRLHWSSVPAWVQLAGAALLLLSFYLFYLTFRENTFLSPAVRIQAERGQTVVSTGPYAVVRHPMYAAFVVYALAVPLLLGSWYGLLVSLLLLGAVARRAVLEERALRQELPGYAAYMQRVRYRFLPRVW